MLTTLSSFPRFRHHAAGCLMVVAALLPPHLSTASQPATQHGSPPPKNQAVVTFLAGRVTTVADGERRTVTLGDTFAPGTRLRLGELSQVTVVWSHGGSSGFSGSRRTVALVPPDPPEEKRDDGAIRVIANVWKAIRTRLARLGRSQEPNTGVSEQPLAVRAPRDAWPAYPLNEHVIPGPQVLRWRGPSGSGPSYLVIIWDEQFVPVWRATVQADEIAVPDSVSLLPGQRYRWAVVTVSSPEVSSPLMWFEVLSLDRSNSLADELRGAEELLTGAKPASQAHLVLGCVYEGYGLLSEAKARYEMAAALSPMVNVYGMLVDESRPPSLLRAEPTSTEER